MIQYMNDRIKALLVFAQSLDELTQLISEHAQDGDVVMCLGAGSIGTVPAQVALKANHKEPVRIKGGAR